MGSGASQRTLSGLGISSESRNILALLLVLLWLLHWLSDTLGLELREEAKALYGQMATTLQKGLNDFTNNNCGTETLLPRKYLLAL